MPSKKIDDLAQPKRGRSKRIVAWSNGHFNDCGHVLYINPNQLRSWTAILNHLTLILNPTFGAVRNVINLDSKKSVHDFEDIEPGGKYVVCSNMKRVKTNGTYHLPKSPGFRKIIELYGSEIQELAKYKYLIETMRNKRMIIYVFRNGRPEAPKKLVLTENDYFNWRSTLHFISQILDIEEGVVYLCTAYGDKLCGPWELQHGSGYIALPYNEKFIQLDYLEIYRKCLPYKKTNYKITLKALTHKSRFMTRNYLTCPRLYKNLKRKGVNSIYTKEGRERLRSAPPTVNLSQSDGSVYSGGREKKNSSFSKQTFHKSASNIPAEAAEWDATKGNQTVADEQEDLFSTEISPPTEGSARQQVVADSSRQSSINRNTNVSNNAIKITEDESNFRKVRDSNTSQERRRSDDDRQSRASVRGREGSERPRSQSGGEGSRSGSRSRQQSDNEFEEVETTDKGISPKTPDIESPPTPSNSKQIYSVEDPTRLPANQVKQSLPSSLKDLVTGNTEMEVIDVPPIKKSSYTVSGNVSSRKSLPDASKQTRDSSTSQTKLQKLPKATQTSSWSKTNLHNEIITLCSRQYVLQARETYAADDGAPSPDALDDDPENGTGYDQVKKMLQSNVETIQKRLTEVNIGYTDSTKNDQQETMSKERSSIRWSVANDPRESEWDNDPVPIKVEPRWSLVNNPREPVKVNNELVPIKVEPKWSVANSSQEPEKVNNEPVPIKVEPRWSAENNPPETEKVNDPVPVKTEPKFPPEKNDRAVGISIKFQPRDTFEEIISRPIMRSSEPLSQTDNSVNSENVDVTNGSSNKWRNEPAEVSAPQKIIVGFEDNDWTETTAVQGQGDITEVNDAFEERGVMCDEIVDRPVHNASSSQTETCPCAHDGEKYLKVNIIFCGCAQAKNCFHITTSSPGLKDEFSGISIETCSEPNVAVKTEVKTDVGEVPLTPKKSVNRKSGTTFKNNNSISRSSKGSSTTRKETAESYTQTEETEICMDTQNIHCVECNLLRQGTEEKRCRSYMKTKYCGVCSKDVDVDQVEALVSGIIRTAAKAVQTFIQSEERARDKSWKLRRKSRERPYSRGSARGSTRPSTLSGLSFTQEKTSQKRRRSSLNTSLGRNSERKSKSDARVSKKSSTGSPRGSTLSGYSFAQGARGSSRGSVRESLIPQYSLVEGARGSIRGPAGGSGRESTLLWRSLYQGAHGSATGSVRNSLIPQYSIAEGARGSARGSVRESLIPQYPFHEGARGSARGSIRGSARGSVRGSERGSIRGSARGSGTESTLLLQSFDQGSRRSVRESLIPQYSVAEGARSSVRGSIRGSTRGSGRESTLLRQSFDQGPRSSFASKQVSIKGDEHLPSISTRRYDSLLSNRKRCKPKEKCYLFNVRGSLVSTRAVTASKLSLDYPLVKWICGTTTNFKSCDCPDCNCAFPDSLSHLGHFLPTVYEDMEPAEERSQVDIHVEAPQNGQRVSIGSNRKLKHKYSETNILNLKIKD